MRLHQAQMGSRPCRVLTVVQRVRHARRNAPQLQQGHHLPRQSLHRGLLLGGELPGLAINGAECAQSEAVRVGQRKTGIEAYVRRARNQGAVRKPRILQRIPHDQRLRLENRVSAKGHVARRLLLIQAHS